MGCRDAEPTQGVPLKAGSRVPLAVVNHRRAHCNNCEHNDRGVCMEFKRKRPDAPAVTEIGIKIANAECPLPPPARRWNRYQPSVQMVKSRPKPKPACTVCLREVSHSMLDSQGVCRWCHTRAENGQRPTGNGAASAASIVPRPFPEPPRRHLHYFLYPRHAETTRYHIEKLREYVYGFEGERVCCVAAGPNTIEQRIRGDLEGLFSQVYVVPNNRRLREVVGFVPSLQRLKAAGADTERDVICFAHGKGQQPTTASDAIVREWTDAMYETVVGNWQQVEPVMAAGYPLAGSFKVTGNFRSTRYRWHYSGSFYWARAADLFSRNWRETCNRWYGSESYPGRHWARNEGYCLFGNLRESRAALCYDPKVWDIRLRTELEEWRETAASST